MSMLFCLAILYSLAPEHVATSAFAQMESRLFQEGSKFDIVLTSDPVAAKKYLDKMRDDLNYPYMQLLYLSNLLKSDLAEAKKYLDTLPRDHFHYDSLRINLFRALIKGPFA